MKQLLLISLITLQGCTVVKTAAYWFEHSENMRMPEHLAAATVNNTECPRPGDF
jgi:hypothetical protein